MTTRENDVDDLSDFSPEDLEAIREMRAQPPMPESAGFRKLPGDPVWILPGVPIGMSMKEKEGARPSLMRRALAWLTKRIDPPRVITDREGTPYLSRYYLWPKIPKAPDGSPGFDETGSPKPGTFDRDRDRSFALYLHHFHRGDGDAELHNHPWKTSFSLILAGGYLEERRLRGTARVIRRVLHPGDFNVIESDDFHRVELLEKDAWTLFLAGSRSQSWGFWNRVTTIYTPWREFVERKRQELLEEQAYRKKRS
jgi:hypothetical protein